MTDKLQDHITQRFNIKEKIGSGAYGHVWRVLDNQDQSKQKALKKNFDAFSNATDAQRTYREVAILSQLRDHPNIIRLDEVIGAQNQKDVYLLFEFMEADLYTLIRQNLLSQRHKKYILYQMALCLCFLHECGLVHRDFKPSNILINEDCQAKLCDFGLVRKVDSMNTKSDYILTEYIATRWYRAPQLLLGSTSYTKSIDVWSYGCLVAEIFTGKPLFPGNSTTNQLERVLSWTGMPTTAQLEKINAVSARQILTMVSNSLRRISHKELFPGNNIQCFSLLEDTLQLLPEKRPSFLQIVMHPYFKEFFKKKDLEDIKRMKRSINLTIDDNQKKEVKTYRELVYSEDKNRPNQRQVNASTSQQASLSGYRIRDARQRKQKNKSLPTQKNAEYVKQSHVRLSQGDQDSHIKEGYINGIKIIYAQSDPTKKIQKSHTFVDLEATNHLIYDGTIHNGGKTKTIPFKTNNDSTLHANLFSASENNKDSHQMPYKALNSDKKPIIEHKNMSKMTSNSSSQNTSPKKMQQGMNEEIQKLIRQSKALEELEKQRLQGRRRKFISQHGKGNEKYPKQRLVGDSYVSRNSSQLAWVYPNSQFPQEFHQLYDCSPLKAIAQGRLSRLKTEKDQQSRTENKKREFRSVDRWDVYSRMLIG